VRGGPVRWRERDAAARALGSHHLSLYLHGEQVGSGNRDREWRHGQRVRDKVVSRELSGVPSELAEISKKQVHSFFNQLRLT
jgi:hypothetical protein